MDNSTYFSFIPFELIELIVNYLNKNDLLSFLDVYNLKHILNWSAICSLHSDIYEVTNFDQYFHILSVEKLKEILKLDEYTLKMLIDEELLYLDDMNLTSLPEEIGVLTNLKILILENNKLTSIPKEIAYLTNLTDLILNDNQLVNIPKEIGKLTNLTTLILNDNQLVNIPRTIRKLTNLTLLCISNNKLNKEEISKLRILLPKTILL